VPAPTPLAEIFTALAVPPVVMEEGVVTKTPLAVKVPAVWVKAGIVMSAPVKVVVPPTPFWFRPPPAEITNPFKALVPEVFVLVTAGRVKDCPVTEMVLVEEELAVTLVERLMAWPVKVWLSFKVAAAP